MSNQESPSADEWPKGGEEHLAELPDGSGCFEIWEYLSDARQRSASD